MRRFVFAIALAFAASASLNLFAATNNSTVGLCAGPGVHYLSIGAAVTGTASGASISICPGTYPEQVTINKSLTLMGVKSGTANAAVIVPPAGGLVANGTDNFGGQVAAQIFVSAPGPVTLKNLTVDGTGNNLAGCGAPSLEGIYYQNTTGSITNNTVRNQYQTDFANFGGCQNGLAINIEANEALSTLTVSGNSVRSYQKNGITATGSAVPPQVGPNVAITGNYIVGLGANALNWIPNAPPAAENGIQIGFGATGQVSGNTVNDHIWPNDTSGDTGDAASGILIYASSSIMVSTNEVGSAQFGIVAVSDSSYGTADNTSVTGNKVVGTQIFDAIDVCSNNNLVKSNTIFGSTEAGVHIDSTCGGTGNNTMVMNNTVNEACAGILLGSGGSNTFTPNTLYNVTNTTLAGDVCPAGPGNGANKRGIRPEPYRPFKK